MDELGSMILGSTPASMPGRMVVPRQEQQARDVDRKKILEDEYQAELARKPMDAADAQRKQSNLDSLRREHGGLPPTPTPVPTAPSQNQDPLASMIAGDGRQAEKPQEPQKMIQPKGIRATASEIAAPVYGGLRGGMEVLGRLFSGERLSSALEQGGAAANEATEKATYRDAPVPMTPENAFMGRRSPYEQYSPGVAIPKAADAAGDATARVSGSPAMGAWVNTAVQALPGLVMPGKFKETPRAVAPPVPASIAGAAADTSVGVGAARANSNPYPKMTGEENARGGPYPVVKTSNIASDVATAEQATRAKIASEILPEDSLGARSGVLSGNVDALRNEHAEAGQSTPTPRGQILKQQIADEQKALSAYSEKRIENTGASPSLVNDYQRGERINGAFAGDDGLRGFFKGEKQKLYDEAYKTVGDNPVQATNLEGLLNSKKFQAELKLKGTKDFTTGLQELYDQHRVEGFEGTKPGSIAGLEELRKSLNAQWSPDNKYAINRAVRAIDEDIATAGGPGAYEKARNLHEFEQKLFESKGMKTLFGDINPLTGTQTATAFEQIPKKLNNMTFDEWRHVYDTADQLSKGKIRFKEHEIEIPPDLMEAAEAAKKEIAGNIAREVHDAAAGKAGVFNQNSLNKTLNARAQKIEHAFPPEEQQAFHTLNYGAQIMPGAHAYEGAALQARRIGALAQGVETAGKIAGAAANKVPIVGPWAVGKVTEKAQGALLTRSMSKEAKALREELQRNRAKGNVSPYDEKMQDLP